MKKKLLILICSAILFFITKNTAFAKIAPSQQQEEMKLKTELSSIQKDIQSLEKNVTSHQKQEEMLNNELATIEKNIGEQTEELRILENQKKSHQQTLAQLKTQINSLQKLHQTQIQALSQLVRESFYHHQKEKLQLLLEPMEWSARLRQETYYRFFSIARKNEISQLSSKLKEVALLQESISKENALIEQTSKNVVAKKAKLNENLQQRKNILVSLNDDLKSYTKRMAYLQQQEHQLEKLFKKLQSRLTSTLTHIAPAQDFAKMKHQLSLPILENNVSFSALPNLKPTSSKKTYINAPNGTPVSAIFTGRVVFAEWLRGVGLLIILDHGNGYLSLYGNNQKLYKGLGEWVNRGEMIARVGQSGGHTEPGLYFEIRKDGQTLDPTPWFSNLG